MENRTLSKSIFLGISIFFGMSLLGYSIFKGLKTFSDKDRVVTVKGLAEMDMMATSAAILLNFSYSGNDLQDLIKQTEKKKSAIIENLKDLGYDINLIKTNNIDVIDRERYSETRYINDKEVDVKISRYTISQSLNFQSKDVKTTEEKISQIKLSLVSRNLTSNIYSNYSFPELNSIKPLLIAESTKNARLAGDQFANDSQAKLGKIKTASQGQISIIGQNSYEVQANERPKVPYIQKARVVSTIVFFLE